MKNKEKKVRAGQDQGRHFLASTNTHRHRKAKKKSIQREFLFPPKQERPVDFIKTQDSMFWLQYCLIIYKSEIKEHTETL